MACGQQKTKKVVQQPVNLIDALNINELIHEDVNLVLLTTDWCSASKFILKSTYTVLCDSLKDQINVVVICASEKEGRFSKYLQKIGVSCPYYLLPKKGDNEFFLEHPDRKRIRRFIRSNLKGYKDLKLEQQFGVPISLFVSKDLRIIAKAPQKISEVITQFNKLNKK